MGAHPVDDYTMMIVDKQMVYDIDNCRRENIYSWFIWYTMVILSIVFNAQWLGGIGRGRDTYHKGMSTSSTNSSPNYQWPFQEHKLEVPTIYKAYTRPM